MVCVQLLSSMLTQGKHIPLNMLPLVLELELADADEAFAETGTSWSITRPRLCADVLSVDNALPSSY